MKLTRKKAIELCIELWTWLAKTGKKKEDWPKWVEYDYTYNDCWFCEYGSQQVEKYNGCTCQYCPLIKKLDMLCGKSYYGKWSCTKAPKTRKKYAKLFLAQIKQCK
jgi:hypothetical protein